VVVEDRVWEGGRGKKEEEKEDGEKPGGKTWCRRNLWGIKTGGRLERGDPSAPAVPSQGEAKTI